MIAEGMLNDQDILAWFTRPSRSINHARIKEIRDGSKHKSVATATPDTLAAYRAAWPQIDPKTGLHLLDDELLVKAREAMLHAVQGYNTPTTYFKSEVFIVLAVIAWTYLLHWHFGKTGVDYRYWKDGSVLKTKYGATKHWELDACLASSKCPLADPTRENLRFLIAIRHEIEHQMTRVLTIRSAPSCRPAASTSIERSGRLRANGTDWMENSPLPCSSRASFRSSETPCSAR